MAGTDDMHTFFLCVKERCSAARTNASAWVLCTSPAVDSRKRSSQGSLGSMHSYPGSFSSAFDPLSACGEAAALCVDIIDVQRLAQTWLCGP